MNAVLEQASEKSTLNAKQTGVMQLIKAGGNVLITGPAGTGKSYLLGAIREQFPSIAVTASTGISALGIKGCTIHSWAGLGLGQEPAEKIAGRLLERKNRSWYVMKSAKQLVIDEISMIDADLFQKLNDVLQIVRKSSKPFGGIQLILIGDYLQLPPVGDDGQAVRFAFESSAWTKAQITVFMLTEVMRQKDREFASILSRVRLGDTAEDLRAVLRTRINAVDPDPTFSPVTLATHNEIADSINVKNLAALPDKEYVWNASDWAENEQQARSLDKNCIAPKTLTLKVGAQVMLLWNIDPEGGLANGSLGKIEEIKESQFGQPIPVVRFTNGILLELEAQEWATIRYGDVISSRRQIPLRLSWAITIHKSQGMTLEKVRVHLKKCFSPGQAYVAMSRAKTLGGLFIADISGDSIKAHSTALEFYRRFSS